MTAMKIMAYSSMTVGAAHAAAPDVVAHDVLVKDGEVNHEHHDEEHVDGKAGPCEAVAMDANAVVRINV